MADDVKVIYVRQYGGEEGAPAVLAPKVGPLGLNLKKIRTDIQTVTMPWKGIRIIAKLAVKNREAEITVVPTASSLILKELKEPLRDRKKVKNIKHNGNLTKATILDIAKQLRFKSQARHMSGTVKEVLGTAFAIGCSIDGKHPRDLQKEIDNGEWVISE